MSSTELAGKVALVTGAARNIGRATALALGAAGAKVAINALSSKADAEATAAAVTAAGGEGKVFLADVTNEKDVADMVAAIKTQFGTIDILVNNAVVRHVAPFLQMSLQEWKSINSIILDGAFICARACIPLMKHGTGRVINLGGITAHTGAVGRAHVVTSKAGMVGFTHALAKEFMQRGITANCVVPGHTNTTRPAGFVPPLGEQNSDGPKSAEPEDIANTIRFLAGPSARHITGQTIHVNGGYLMS